MNVKTGAGGCQRSDQFFDYEISSFEYHTEYCHIKAKKKQKNFLLNTE